MLRHGTESAMFADKVRPRLYFPKASFIKSASAPMDLVFIDILSGLPELTNGCKYILVAVDSFTRWVEAYALLDSEASTCMTALYNNFFLGLVYRVSCTLIKVKTSKVSFSKKCVA